MSKKLVISIGDRLLARDVARIERQRFRGAPIVALRSVLFVLTLAGLLAVLSQPARKNPVPQPALNNEQPTTGMSHPNGFRYPQLAMVVHDRSLSGSGVLNGLASLYGNSAEAIPQMALSMPVWSALDCPAPVPGDLAAGEYLVSNTRGLAGRLIILGDNRNDSRVSSVRAVTAGNVGWVFVRQGEVSGDSQSLHGNVAGKPIYLNRKFDFGPSYEPGATPRQASSLNHTSLR